MTERKQCPKCGEIRLVGPWRDGGDFVELCGGCKIDAAMARPGARQRLADAAVAAAKVKP